MPASANIWAAVDLPMPIEPVNPRTIIAPVPLVWPYRRVQVFAAPRLLPAVFRTSVRTLEPPDATACQGHPPYRDPAFLPPAGAAWRAERRQCPLPARRIEHSTNRHPVRRCLPCPPTSCLPQAR